MTSNQIAYAQLLESQRSNRAKEMETERSNRAKERETERANKASEVEKRRSNLASEYNASEKNASSIRGIWGALGYGFRNLGRSSQGTTSEIDYARTGNLDYSHSSATSRGTNPHQPVRGFQIYA